MVEAKSSSAAKSSSTPARQWTVIQIEGTEYVRLDDLCAFYGFKPLTRNQGKPGCISYGVKNRTISVRPGGQDFYVNNYRYVLSHPIKQLAGLHMISSVDVRKLVDPVLRPRLSNTPGGIKTVVIDAGHGGHDAGAVSKWCREKEVNLQLARKLRERLVKHGLNVVMTRDSDIFLTLQQRVAIANKHPNSIFVSIHHNSGRAAASGIETFTLAPVGTTSPFAKTRRQSELAGNHQDSENIALATAVHSRCIRATGAIDRGIQRAAFSVLCTIKRPAILFEGGFVSNSTEGQRIANSAYQDTLADSMANGIINYCQLASGKTGVTPKTNSAKPSGGGSVRGSSTVRGSGSKGAPR